MTHFELRYWFRCSPGVTSICLHHNVILLGRKDGSIDNIGSHSSYEFINYDQLVKTKYLVFYYIIRSTMEKLKM